MDQNQSTSREGGEHAPGWPGVAATWTSSAKNGVGTALNSGSRVWFTIGHGILNEIYYPRVDTACTRDLGFIVTDGQDFFSEEKRHTNHQIEQYAPGVPLYRVINTSEQQRYLIEKEIFGDPEQDSMLQRIRFNALEGSLDDYHLYVLLAPHLGNQGGGNNAWVGDFKGDTMLFAQRGGLALALACSVPFVRCSVGFVGTSDGWQDLNQHKVMAWSYERAENGNVALNAELDLPASNGEFVLALGFGSTPGEAAHRARASLLSDFNALRDQYIRGWEGWQRTLLPLEDTEAQGGQDLYRVSTTVLRTHEAKTFPGGFIASLSIPWGFSKGDGDIGGYHLVWPRDLVETAGGMLACGGSADMARVLHYLRVIQEAAGDWPQNNWLDGTHYWSGQQLDETALPILLLELAIREGAVSQDASAALWPMVRRAAGFIARNGPVTQQDRWEENAGYTAFSLAAEVAALLIAADIAAARDEQDIAQYLRETADAWNANIEHWTYVKGTDIAKQVGVEGYYVRIVPPRTGQSAGSPFGNIVYVKNRPAGDSAVRAADIVSIDALALVRFGLRAADDPRILNTIKVIDALLKIDTPFGPAWHRYNDDGYGEQEDGAPFDGVGLGRVWPLLSGERAHYELAAGRKDLAEKLLHTMEAFAGNGGLLPEQVWDADDIADKGLYCGRPSGSAMPLVWAHAEYVKLRRSLRDGRVFDMPRQTHERYVIKKTGSLYAIWRFNTRIRRLPQGKVLRVELHDPAVVHWSSDGWQTTHDSNTHDTGLGVHLVDLPVQDLAAGSHISFTCYWPQAQRWEGADFSVEVIAPVQN